MIAYYHKTVSHNTIIRLLKGCRWELHLEYCAPWMGVCCPKFRDHVVASPSRVNSPMKQWAMNTQRQCRISQQNSFQYPTTQIMYEGGVKNAVTMLLTAKCLNLTAMNVQRTNDTYIPFSFCLRLLKQKLSWRHFNTNVDVQCKHEWHHCLSGWLQTVTAGIWIILQHIGTHVVTMKADMLKSNTTICLP